MPLPIFKILLIVIFGHGLVIGQSRNIKYEFQGITKLGIVGQKFLIECPLTGPFYLWRLYQSNAESRVLLDQDSKIITIDSATTKRSGIYECKSTTGFGNAIINITLKIIDPNLEISKEICSFRKVESPQDFLGGLCFLNDNYIGKYQYKVGSDIELECESVGTNLMYYWTFIDQNGSPDQIYKSSNATKLIITHISSGNEGTYKCEVKNDEGQKIQRTFSVAISDITSESGIVIIGKKNITLSLKHGENISLVCEIKNSYQRIHSIKWGKRIGDPVSDSQFTSNIVFWDQHNYRLLPSFGIAEIHRNPNEVTNSLTLTKVDETNSGVYICLAMNTFGGTAYKLFNITVSLDRLKDLSGKRSQFFFLYILTPAILIFVCVCAVVYCCVKRSSSKSSNSVPLKQYNSSIPSNGNKTTTSNYYYPVTSTRTNCPPLPEPTESQASMMPPNTVISYASYGNYQFVPSNQPPYSKTN